MFWSILFLLAWSAAAESSYCSFSKSLQERPLQVAFAAPDTFGKTHFIVGQSDFFELPETKSPAPVGVSNKRLSIRSLFSPDDDVKKELISLINKETEAIHAAIFILTEPEIARALARAQKRGVAVALVTDVGCLKERANKMNMLCDQGCSVFVYNPPAGSTGSSLMHHKFALFDSQSTLWTGSYNFTKAASKSNQENAIVVKDHKTFQKFAAQFQRLKERSYRYSKSLQA